MDSGFCTTQSTTPYQPHSRLVPSETLILIYLQASVPLAVTDMLTMQPLDGSIRIYSLLSLSSPPLIQNWILTICAFSKLMYLVLGSLLKPLVVMIRFLLLSDPTWLFTLPLMLVEHQLASQ